MDDEYSGVSNLEVMSEAVNYNNYLLSLITTHQFGSEDAVLDYGAGMGTFAIPLYKKGINVQAVEVSKQFYNHLKINGILTFKSSHEIKDSVYTLIYSFNVLEHIKDDASVLAEFFRLIKPDGELIVYVPAFNILYTSMDRKVGHLRRYRRKQLMQLIKQANFEIITASYVDSLGFFAALFYKVFGNKSGRLNLTAVSLYDRFIFPISLVCDRLFGHFFGKNLLIRAKLIGKPED